MKEQKMILLLVFLSCVSSVTHVQAGGAVGSPDSEQKMAVKIALTAFDVNDQNLRLTYKITNGSEQAVWLCEGIRVLNGPNVKDYEVYLDQAATLVIRRRLEVLDEITEYEARAYRGTYVRLRPGEERTESLSLALPVQPYYILSAGYPHPIEHVTHLTVQIGFYEGDLPGMIRRICGISEKLNCAKLTFADIGVENAELYEAYFGGLRISGSFGGLAGFDEAYEAGCERITVPHMWPVRLGERSLQIDVDGVPLPYVDK